MLRRVIRCAGKAKLYVADCKCYADAGLHVGVNGGTGGVWSAEEAWVYLGTAVLIRVVAG